MLRALKRRKEVLPLLQNAYQYFKNDESLLGKLVGELIYCGENDEALKLAWAHFEHSPNKHGYDFLGLTARSCHQGKVYLEKVIIFLSAQLNNRYDAIAARSAMVKIRQSEKDYARALEIAVGGLCKHETLYSLAAALAKKQPDASAKLMKRPIDQLLPRTGDHAYAESTNLLKLYKKYLISAGKTEQFQQEVSVIRQQYKKGRNFIAMLDKNGLK